MTGDQVERVTPLARARGLELGGRSVPRRGLQNTVAAWTLSLDSDLLFVGDAGTTTAGRPSRRYGIEVSTVYAPHSWLTFDADVSISRGRFQDFDIGGSYIPGALERVVAGGVTVHERRRVGGSVRVRHFGPRALTEDGTVRSRPTSMANAQLVVAVSQRAGWCSTCSMSSMPG